MDRSTEQTLREEIAQLRREVTAQGAQANTRRSARKGRPAWRRWFTLVIAIACMAMAPLSIMAANPFTDLTGGPHDGNIDAIFNAGITTGCSPTEYCPTANVTREEMASFIARTAGVGENKPVTNAARLALRTASVGGTTYAANDLVGAVRNSDDSAKATTDVPGAAFPQAVLIGGAPINVPGPGYILVNSSGTFRFDDGCAATCTVRWTLEGSPAAEVAKADTNIVSLSRTWLVRVTEAGTVNLDMQIGVVRPGVVGTPNSGVAKNVQITGLYVPFGTLNNGAPGDISNVVAP